MELVNEGEDEDTELTVGVDNAFIPHRSSIDTFTRKRNAGK
jgi:hypothetical protein